MLWLVGFLTWIILGTTPHERAISAVDQAVARMVGTLPDPGQGESPAKPDDAPIREVLAREGTSKVADVLDLLIRGGLRLHFRSVSDGQEAFRVNYENNTLVTFPPARAQPFVTIVLRRFPEQLLLNAQRRPEALRWLGTQTVDGRKYEVVAYGDVDGEVDDLYFDAITHELARVQRLNDDPVRGDAPIATLYTHVGASAELDALADELTQVSRLMNGINRSRFTEDPDVLAEWESASNVIGPPRAGGQPGGRSGGQVPAKSEPPTDVGEIKPAA